MVYKWVINHLSNWWPQSCLLCGQTSHRHSLCADCIQDLPRFTASCFRCGLPIAPLAGADLCGQCQQHAPGYDRVIAAFAYATPVSQLVAQLKFQQRLQLARLFGELLAARIAPDTALPQALIPVPLHPNRLRTRGYNQALEIARPLGRILSLPVLADSVRRRRDTAPQSAQAAEQRQQNIRGAFRLNKPLHLRHVAIVDDVMTSGHTVGEMAGVLREAGVEQIEVWCVARAWPKTKSGI